MTELKACPYCGESVDLGTAKPVQVLVIRCGNCGAYDLPDRTDYEVLIAWATGLTKPADELLPCGHSIDNLGGFGGCNPNGSCLLCASNKPVED